MYFLPPKTCDLDIVTLSIFLFVNEWSGVDDEDVQNRLLSHMGRGQPVTGDGVFSLHYHSSFIKNYAKWRGSEEGKKE